ncbi:MAG: SDR family oxidoreductase [Proteobacteria bacterium]|nr:SDR family oxidoreductase [Pseudomonadota bacterium]
MVDFSLKDRIALVTGASRGIGQAIAEAFSANGAHVILVSRKLEGLEKVVSQIKANGGSAEAMACHMGQMDQIDALYQAISKKFGKLHILVNNAATNPYFGDMLGVDEKIWDKTNEVNLKGPFFMIQRAIPLMAAAGKGSVINVSSVNGVSPALLQGVYSITKAGVISMTKAFAKELGNKNIRVNAILPGLTDTKFAEALIGNEMILNAALQSVPMGRYAKPEEMTGAALYLASDASSYTTGTLVVCDGGMLA